MNSTSRREGLIASLRDFAAFLESNPELPVCGVSSLGADAFVYDKDLFLRLAPLMAGATRKEHQGQDRYLTLTRKFGPFSYSLWVPTALIGERRIEVQEVEVFEYPDYVPGGAL